MVCGSDGLRPEWSRREHNHPRGVGVFEVNKQDFMQCQICNKRTATIHLTEISEGVRTEMHICEQCAAEQGIAAQSQMSINELLSHLLASQPGDDEIFGPSDKDRCARTAGSRWPGFGRRACWAARMDYEVFEAALLPLIERAHGGKTTHCGQGAVEDAQGHQAVRGTDAAAAAVGRGGAERGL